MYMKLQYKNIEDNKICLVVLIVGKLFTETSGKYPVSTHQTMYM